MRAAPNPRDVRACRRFPGVKMLNGFDFGFATGVPRPQIHELAPRGQRRQAADRRAL
jgi:hypothetical protein